jgi:hypothetical protein
LWRYPTDCNPNEDNRITISKHSHGQFGGVRNILPAQPFSFRHRNRGALRKALRDEEPSNCIVLRRQAGRSLGSDTYFAKSLPAGRKKPGGAVP